MTSSLPVTSLDHFRGLTGRSDVEGLVAVVTGGNAGLGLYAAQALALNGAKVYILGRRDDVLKHAASSLDGVNSVQGTLIPVQADVTSKESLKNAVDVIESHQGERGIDVLLCNAGVSGKMMKNYGKGGYDTTNFEAIVSELDSFSQDDFDHIFHVNVMGPYLSSIAFLQTLRKGSEWHKAQAKKEGSEWPAYTSQVIVVSSNAASINIVNALYNVSKAAASHWSTMLSCILTDSSIRVNTLEPGLYPTDMTGASLTDPGTGHGVLKGTNGADIPAGRAGFPHEHAASVLYLSSRNSLFANGARLRVDGGAILNGAATD
ncbi:Reductases with broad range of substrate specificities [Ceraceosorus bombacis]|uniref:Reductases with broad range of substrate specificities n=1 Tax=Ceraceosorus bombacis TaxID=401625 RepID=A0A0P1BQH7_9BASI|nr:Reductases with broad range of substrate specificities [Ceraceosorus bombacis]